MDNSADGYRKALEESSIEKLRSERDRLYNAIREQEIDHFISELNDEDSDPEIEYAIRLENLAMILEILAEKTRALSKYDRSFDSYIEITKNDITSLQADAVVNPANSMLKAGTGISRVIYEKAGARKLDEACGRLESCRTGSAVITSGFELSRYIIHCVGPVYMGGNNREKEYLESTYRKALNLAGKYHCESIAFPLISCSTYPLAEAWQIALKTCEQWIRINDRYRLKIMFGITEKDIYEMGFEVAKQEGIAVTGDE